jgi:hypothetical protein
MAMHTQLINCADPTREIHQSRTLTVPDDTDRYAKLLIRSTRHTATHGTPCLFSRARTLGAWPLWARPSIARDAEKTNELAVEKIETRMRALTRDGRPGIPRRFIAGVSAEAVAVSAVEDISEQTRDRPKREKRETTLTDNIWRLCSSGRTSCDRTQQVRVIRGGYDTDAEGTGHVEENDTVDDGVECFG